MGGQACVFYGAAEFSRDCDIVILAEQENLTRLAAALDDLQAECIAVPPMDWSHLQRGHAIHFRCHHPDAAGMRLDVMTKMRGCGDFASLWTQRTSIQDADGFIFELLGIEDLVKAKKTQRDKDWPMIRRLVDAHYDAYSEEPTDERVRFWLRESRTPETLIGVAAEHSGLAREMIRERPLLVQALAADRMSLQQELDRERLAEQEADRKYWKPLVKELEAMRQAKRQRRTD